MDVRTYNRERWNRQVASGNPWTVPVSPELVARARRGDWSVLLTSTRPVPRSWFPPLEGCELLGLACGGGQQGPVFAAAGARVTILDNSPRQLGRDREVAEREGLRIETVEGDMRDLSSLGDSSFDLVFHPVSNCFVPDVSPVWREAFRVLRPGGILLAGFNNPVMYVFDTRLADRGEFVVKHRLPFDASALSEAERAEAFAEDDPLEFSHSLEEQIGGQLEGGFRLTAMYEDSFGTNLGTYFPHYIATRSVKPRGEG